MPIKLIVSAATACGKTTLVKHIENDLGYRRLKTCTTRKPREGESLNDYYFIEEGDYQTLLDVDAFIEHATVYGKHYGLMKSEVGTSENEVVILDIQGMKAFKKIYPDAVTMFLLPPTMDVIQSRLEGRNSPKEEIELRLKETVNEINASQDYDYRIEYDTIDVMWDKIKNILLTLS